jgi:hypothetical protein
VAPLIELPIRTSAARVVPVADVPIRGVAMRADAIRAEAVATATTGARPAATARRPTPTNNNPLPRFLADVSALARAEDAAELWVARRAEIAPLSPLERAAAWNGLCVRVQTLAGIDDPKAYLKAAVAELVARSVVGAAPANDARPLRAHAVR